MSLIEVDIPSVIARNIDSVAEFVIARSLRELRQQGHEIDMIPPGYSESLAESFSYKVTMGETFVNIAFQANDYAETMDTGLSSSQITHSAYDLIPYIQVIKPNLSLSGTLAYAKGLHKIQLREGIPTEAAYNYSKNGRRTGWTEHALRGQEDRILKMVEKIPILESIVDRLTSILKGMFSL